MRRFGLNGATTGPADLLTDLRAAREAGFDCLEHATHPTGAALEDPGVGLVIDAFHFYAGGSTWEMLEGLHPRQLFIVHLDDAEDRPRSQLADAHRLLPGDGVIPLKDLVRRIEALGYTGPYSIELFRPEYYAWDPVRLARVAKEKMEALFR